MGWTRQGQNIATVFVKPIRHTFSFMERHSIFTICWFPKDKKKDLGILGSKSGKDCDKIALTSLTPKAVGEGVGYSEAMLTLVCKKIYTAPLIKDRIPEDVVASFYTDEEPHHMFIGEIITMLK